MEKNVSAERDKYRKIAFDESKILERGHPVGIYLLKVNNRNTRARCEICSKLTIKTPERRQWPCSSDFIVNFEHVIAGWVNMLNDLPFTTS